MTFSLCLSVVREHEQAVIIVPTLLLLATLVTLLAVCLMRYCHERKQTRITSPQHYRNSSRRHTQRRSHRHHLQGIDGEQASIMSLCICFSSYSCWIFHYDSILTKRTTNKDLSIGSAPCLSFSLKSTPRDKPNGT